MLSVKAVLYTVEAAKDLKRHRNMARRIRKAIGEYAAGTGARANNVTPLAGSSAKRLKIGDFRVIFEESAETITVTKIDPRGGVYQ